MARSSSNRTAMMYSLPFMGFMIFGWYGLASVVQSKRDVRGATNGLESLEEMDPMEKMRRRYNLDRGEVEQLPEIPSLEDELLAVHKKVNIHDFDYKPVPRLPDDDEPV